MPTRTVNQGFQGFLKTLTPTFRESKAAKFHRASIMDCLASNFNMTSFFRTGSFGHGTSVSKYSDVDYFAVIPRDNLKRDSTKTLYEIRLALGRRFTSTRIRVDRPAVVVSFGPDGKEKTEITPANYIGSTKNDGYNVYQIPDCSGGWIDSSPGAHNNYVSKVDGSRVGRVRDLIRLVKAWKYYRNVPISSFYLELRVTKYAEDMSRIIYDQDLAGVFSHLYDIKLAQMQDPMGVSGYIAPCSTKTKLSNAKSKLATALIRAEKACEASVRGDIITAFYWWNLVYNGKFPNYKY